MQQATQVNVTFPGTIKTGKQASVFPKKQKMKAAFVYVPRMSPNSNCEHC